MIDDNLGWPETLGIVVGILIFIIFMSYGIHYIISTRSICVQQDYEYYKETHEGFVSCCRENNEIDVLGNFKEECEVFPKP